MNILAMDTSGPSLSVALTAQGKLLYECIQQNGLTHSDSLMPLVDRALTAGGLTPAQVDCYAVVTGPGSFTGVRIGVTTAKSLAHATGKPVAGVSALEVMAAGVPFFEGAVCPMQDARAGQVYCAAYRGDDPVLPDSALKLGDLLERLRPLGRCCFVGDGAVAHRAAIAQAMGEAASFAPSNLMIPRASTLALLVDAQPGRIHSWETLAPYYLRAPQAERERLAREAQSHA